MSELLDKQVNAQKERNLRGSRKPTKKVGDETKKKRRACNKNFIKGRKPFITPIQNTGDNDFGETIVDT